MTGELKKIEKNSRVALSTIFLYGPWWHTPPREWKQRSCLPEQPSWGPSDLPSWWSPTALLSKQLLWPHWLIVISWEMHTKATHWIIIEHLKCVKWAHVKVQIFSWPSPKTQKYMWTTVCSQKVVSHIEYDVFVKWKQCQLHRVEAGHTSGLIYFSFFNLL